MQQRTNFLIWIYLMFSSIAVSYAQQPKLMLPVGHLRGINNAVLSPDEKIIATASSDRTVKIWETISGRLLYSLDNFTSWVWFARFSPDGSKMLTSSGDKTIRIWDTKTFTILSTIEGFENDVMTAEFSPDSKSILTVDWHHSLQLWESKSGKSVFKVDEKDKQFEKSYFSPDGKLIASTTQHDSSIEIREAVTGKVIKILKGHSAEIRDMRFSIDAKFLGTFSLDQSVKIWDLKSFGNNAQSFKLNSVIHGLVFSPDNNQISISTLDGIIYAGNVKSGELVQLSDFKQKMINTSLEYSKDSKLIFVASENSNIIYVVNEREKRIVNKFLGHKEGIKSILLFNNGRSLLSASADKTAMIWKVGTGEPIVKLAGRNNEKYNPVFTPNGKYFVISSTTAKLNGEQSIDVWNTLTGVKIFSIFGGWQGLSSPGISRDERTMVVYCRRDSAYLLFNLGTGRLLSIVKTDSRQFSELPELKDFSLLENEYDNKNAGVSPDGKKMIKVNGNVCEVWLVSENKKLYSYTAKGTNNINKATFSNDNTKIFISDFGSNIQIVNAGSGKFVKNIEGFTYSVSDSQNIFAAVNKSSIDFYTCDTYAPLYRAVAIDSTDYLVIDKNNHYDGTEAARKLIYFTCDREVIDLEQVKDQLWVPNLGERILKGDTINAKTLDQLNVCGLTPEVEKKDDVNGYHFKITPHRGGLGETVLYVNGIEAKRYKPAQLIKTTGGFELKLKKEELRNYFIAGQENEVTVKSYTSDNTISSRGVKINEDKSKGNTMPPNLYAVMVGVSDYKGDELDLKYAAKDANDISSAVSNAAKKLLNTDGKEHVFMYNLTTAKEHYQLPEKKSIKNILEEIGKKATANDILLIFFAGHGVMSDRADTDREGEKKQFYFLTADASKSSAASAVSDVGISTTELTEWMKPQHIKAQKRILIFDACNSGQAINDFVKMGNGDQNYLAARNDDKAQQIKAIDKLNEKSGLFILSASSSNQSAYEMGRYSQGLLTYSLLKAIKQQPDILEDGKLLNVSRWFNAAEKSVTELARESGARQEPQVVSNTNFNIGLVDEEVMAKIILPAEKPLFAASNFQNSDEAVADDDLELSKQINLQLNDLAIRGTDSKIVYVTVTNSPDAYSLSGRYSIKGNTITVNVNIKQNKAVKSKFELSGTKDQLSELAAAIADKAAGIVN